MLGIAIASARLVYCYCVLVSLKVNRNTVSTRKLPCSITPNLTVRLYRNILDDAARELCSGFIAKTEYNG